jgi:hypothetical protein
VKDDFIFKIVYSDDMRLKRPLSGLFLLFLFFSIHGLRGDTYEEVEGAGLVIRSEPHGAKVYIDGVERGLTPFTIADIRHGTYHIRLVKDGYVERRFRVTVQRTSRLVVSIDLETAKGQVLLRIDRSAGSPSGEKLKLSPVVFADGGAVQGPVLNLPIGWRTIRVRAFGWEDEVRTVYVVQGMSRQLDIEMSPASFRLTGAAVSRSVFNPANSGSLGTTEISFEVSAPGQGRVVVLDAGGETVFLRELSPFITWSRKVAWDGRSWDGRALPDGNYRIVIEAESIPWDDSEPAAQRAEIHAAIDSSIKIHPLSVLSGIGGLFFAPLPEIIPLGSFQIEGSFLFGRAPVSGEAWASLPFGAAFRLSPIENFEIAAAVNALPKFDAGAVYGAAGSVKWRFLPSLYPLDIAAGLSYGWTQEGALTPFGAGAGLELFLPLAYSPWPHFSFAVTPALIWTGEEGYPTEGAPRVLLSGGVFFTYGFVTAGLSFRSEYRFGGETGFHPGPFMAGLECRIFPPPSNLFFNVLAGFWFEGAETGGYGGVGIGLIY